RLRAQRGAGPAGHRQARPAAEKVALTLSMRIVAIEEHFITPMYRDKVAANEFRNFYLSSRGAAMGHDIIAENLDLGASRIAHMDAAGVDVQVLSFGSPGPQAFAADVAVPMAGDANDRLFQAVQSHPTRFAGFSV